MVIPGDWPGEHRHGIAAMPDPGYYTDRLRELAVQIEDPRALIRVAHDLICHAGARLREENSPEPLAETSDIIRIAFEWLAGKKDIALTKESAGARAYPTATERGHEIWPHYLAASQLAWMLADKTEYPSALAWRLVWASELARNAVSLTRQRAFETYGGEAWEGEGNWQIAHLESFAAAVRQPIMNERLRVSLLASN